MFPMHGCCFANELFLFHKGKIIFEQSEKKKRKQLMVSRFELNLLKCELVLDYISLLIRRALNLMRMLMQITYNEFKRETFCTKFLAFDLHFHPISKPLMYRFGIYFLLHFGCAHFEYFFPFSLCTRYVRVFGCV